MSVRPQGETVVVGAGPYGLSVAAHLTGYRVPHRAFGVPMESWQRHMPKGMFLKSDGFASDLTDRKSTFRLKQFCAETGREYHDTAMPIPLQLFIDYGQEFQRRLVPELEQVKVTGLKRNADGSFTVTTATGETLAAKNVVLASGIAELEWMPPEVEQLSKEWCSHSADHNDMSVFAGKKIAVVGGGSSALDCAALAQEAGAQVDLIARRPAIRYNMHNVDKEKRPLIQRLKYPRSGLGWGWKSKISVDMAWLIHMLPHGLRARLVQRHLGPAATAAVKEKVEGKVRQHMSSAVVKAEPRDGKLHLTVRSQDGKTTELTVDHLLTGTGYKPLLQRVGYIDEGLRGQIKTLDDRPVLDRHFQSSVPGLYFTGLMAASSFGPAQRFACGADYAAKQVSKHIASR